MFSWLLEQLLKDLPTWLWPSVAGVGALAYFFASLLSTFPVFKLYSKFIKPVAFIVILIGTFMYGGAGVTAILKEQMAEQKAQIAAAEQASADANNKLEKKSKEKQKVRVEYYAKIKERIVEKEKQIDAECKLDPAVPKILNDAARNPLKVAK